MAAVKAFMSDQDARKWWQETMADAYSYTPSDRALWMDDRLGWPAEALREAERIIAETEPPQDNRMLGPGYWSAFEIGEQYPNTSPMADAGASLAEALAAFIAAPNPE